MEFKNRNKMAMNRHDLSKTVQHSKALSYILRHGAVEKGVPITKDGFVKLDDILNDVSFRRVSKEELIKIVNDCPKQRFSIKYDDDQTAWIRATQGHSLACVDIDLKEIDNPGDLVNCIHGTYHRFWNHIRKDGLSKMKRQHIHCSEDFPGCGQVISGMRSTCQIAIFVDVKKAFEDGIKFYRSENNVILTPGDDNGFLKPKYFLKVLDLTKNECLEL